MGKATVNEAKLKELRERHQWHACLALERAFGKNEGNRDHQLEWVAIVEAAYHAGAAKALYEATF